jgi:hypothetical protein
MAPTNKHYPVFEKGSPSAHYLQITNFSVNYLEALLVNLMHLELPMDLDKPDSNYETLQKHLLKRERTVRHAFQFQIEKLFSDFKLIRRTRLNTSRASDWLSLGLAGENSSRVQNSIESISNRYQKQFEPRLQTLLKRLKTLVHRTDEVMDDNPLSPQKLCYAFYASIEALNLTSIKTTQLFELFDHILDEQLGNFYIQMDLGMYYLDILPELTDPALFNTVPAGEPDLQDDTPSVVTIPELAVPNDREYILLVNKHLRSRKEVIIRKKENRAKLEHQITIFRQAILSGSFEHARNFDEFKKNIKDLITPQQEQEIYKFIRYFSNLLNNSLLSAPTSQQLSRLSCALVELVMIEPNFFISISHPVNDFIQSIIDFEIRATHQGKSLEELTRIVDRLVTLESPTEADFLPFIEEYEKFRKGEMKLLALQIEQQQQLDNALKSDVLKLVNDITRTLVVDRETLSFFYDDWQLLLLQIARKIGFESDEFNQSLEIAKVLAWSLDENKGQSHPEYHHLSFSSLLKAIDKGLNSLNFSSEHRNRVRKQLVKEFRQCSLRASISVVSFDSDHTNHDISQFSMMIGDKSSQLTDMNKRATVAESLKAQSDEAAKMELGTWVEIRPDKNTQYKRAKLKWKSLDSSQFIFVDQRGHKIKQTQAQDLGIQLADGRIKILNTPSKPAESRARLGGGYDFINEK